jgi:hypothetical protein
MNSTKAHFEAVVEFYERSEKPPWPWPIVDFDGFIRLYGQTSEPETGSVMATLLSYNRLEKTGTPVDLLSRIIDAKTLVLPGGLAVIAPDVEPIFPSCCCGLEGWREWISAISSRQSPWLGHDPWPWVEFAEDGIHVWCDGGLGGEGSYSIDFTESAFREALHEVHRDLIAFLGLCKKWAEAIGFSASNQFVNRLDRAFSIFGEWDTEKFVDR